jgi:hypothetical protein
MGSACPDSATPFPSDVQGVRTAQRTRVRICGFCAVASSPTVTAERCRIPAQRPRALARRKIHRRIGLLGAAVLMAARLTQKQAKHRSMPAMVTLDLEHGIRITTATGPTSVADFLGIYRTVVADPSLAMATRSLIDLRQACLSGITRDDVQRAIELPKLPRQTETRLAIVASSPLTYGLSRMYAMMQAGRRAGEVQVFNTLDEALAWLTARGPGHGVEVGAS